MSLGMQGNRVTFVEAYNRLSNVVEAPGENFRAECPICGEDKLYIKEKNDGGVLAYCHSGCPFFEIVSAIRYGWDRDKLKDRREERRARNH